MVWVCRMCSTNNVGGNKRCYVCDQKRPFGLKFKFKRINRVTLGEKIFTKLVAWYKKLFSALVTLMGISLGVLIILRAVEGDMYEVLNTLALLWENGKEVVITSFTKTPVSICKSIGWRPLIALWDNFGHAFANVGVHLVGMIFNFIDIFPKIGKHLLRFFQWVFFFLVRVKDSVVLLLMRINIIMMKILESIVQFIERIGV